MNSIAYNLPSLSCSVRRLRLPLEQLKGQNTHPVRFPADWRNVKSLPHCWGIHVRF